MGRIDYKAIFEQNQDEWKALTRDPQKYEALLAGHYSDSNHFVYQLLQNPGRVLWIRVQEFGRASLLLSLTLISLCSVPMESLLVSVGPTSIFLGRKDGCISKGRTYIGFG